jgi:autotransporter-associated beta strand protein
MQFTCHRARTRASFAVVSAVAAAVASSRVAVAKTWDNSSLDGSWKTASNWDDNVLPTTATPVVLPSGFPGSVSTITATGGTADAQSLTFNDGYTLAGTSVLNLGGTGDVTVASGVTAAIDNVIGGTVGLRKLGPGTLVLNGTNTYTGGTQITAGVLQIDSDARLGGASSSVNVSNGGALRTTATISTSRAVNFLGSGGTVDVATGASTLTLSGAMNITGSLFKAGAGTLVLSGGSGNNPSAVTFVNAGTVRLAKSSGVAVGPLEIAANGRVVLDNSEQISTAALTINGQLDLNGFNETVGAVQMTAGEIIGSSTLTLGGAAGGNDVFVFATTGASTVTASISFNAQQRTFNVTDGVNANDFVVDGRLIGGSLVKDGQGNFVSKGSQPNTQANTTINAGTLTLQKDAGVQAAQGTVTVGDGVGSLDTLRIAVSEQITNTGSLVIAGSGVVDLGGGVTEIINNITMSGGAQVTGANGTLVMLGDLTTNPSAAPATIASEFQLSGTRTLTVADGAAGIDLQITGSLSAGDLVKAGAGTLVLGNGSARTGTTTINAGTLSIADNSYLGAAGGQLNFGDGGSAGTVTLATTASFSTGRFININGPAVAAFDVLAGTVLGATSDGFGTGGMLKTGGGTMVSTGNITLSGTAGSMTVDGGTFSHSAGTKSIGGTLRVGGASSSNGSYTLSAGVLTVSNNFAGLSTGAIGGSGTGSFAQTGGTFNVSGTNSSLVVGEGSGGVGSYTISAGTLNARRIIVGRDNGASGTVNVTGGTVNVGLDVYVGGNAGGGGGAGVLNVSGGTLAVAGDARVWDTSGGTAINLSSAGTLRVGSLRTSGNVFRFAWSGGTLEFTSESPMIGTGADLGTSVTLSAGKTLRVSGASKTINVRGTGTINYTGGKADLTDKKMIVVNGTVGTASGGVYTGLTRQIQLAHNGGAWNGSGITTSKPDAAAGLTAIAIGMSGDLGYNGQNFGGVSVSGNTALLMYTYAGDANLDGFVSGDDYSGIDFGILVPGMSGWTNGDFNYDGAVTGDDYSAIDFAILAQGAPFPINAAAPSGVTAVPEPASGVVAGVAFAAVTLRRRRRKRS